MVNVDCDQQLRYVVVMHHVSGEHGGWSKSNLLKMLFTLTV